MESKDLKNKAFSGMLWKLMERIGAQGVSLIVSIVLARLLTPTDYSVVGIVNVFFIFCNVFVTGGFNAALIQKKDADRRDYSSVLQISLLIAGLLYAGLFFTAPAIADIYENPLLIPVFRVMGLTLFIEAVNAVLVAYVSSRLDFKKFFFSTLGSTVISAVLGVAMALGGFGPWALVVQRMSNSLINVAVLTIATKFKIQLGVSFRRLKGLFSYGWKIFVASIISTIYDQINPLIIGIKFRPEDLSYYTKGKSYPALLHHSLDGTLSAVLFPVMSKVQDDKSAVLGYTRRFMQVASYILFPVMIGFLAVSDNFVRILLTEKWMPASTYIKIYCVTYMFTIIQNGNLQTIRAIGRSDTILKLEIIKKTLYSVVIVAAVIFSDSPEMLACATVVNTVIATLVNISPNKKLIGYGALQQITDLLPNLWMSVAMGAVVFAMNYLKINIILLMFLQILAGAGIYVGLSMLTKNKSFLYLLDSLRGAKKK